MIKQRQWKKLSPWHQYFILLILIPTTIALLLVVAQGFFPRLAAKLVVMVVLVVCSGLLLFLKKQHRRNEPPANSTEQSVNEADRLICKVNHGRRRGRAFEMLLGLLPKIRIVRVNKQHRLMGHPSQPVVISVAKMECARCKNLLQAEQADMLENIQSLKEKDFVISCKACGAYYALQLIGNDVSIAREVPNNEIAFSGYIWGFIGSIMAVGAIMFGIACVNPDQHNPIIQWLLHVVFACVSLACFVFAVFFLGDFFSTRKRMKHFK